MSSYGGFKSPYQVTGGSTQRDQLLKRLRKANLRAVPKEPQGFPGNIIPDFIEKPATAPFGLAGKAAGQVANALIYSPAGLYEMGKAFSKDWADMVSRGDFTPERLAGLVEQSGRQIYEDVRHPLRNPGYLALDVLGAASLGAGTAARTTGALGRLERLRKGEDPDVDPGVREPMPSGIKPPDDDVEGPEGQIPEEEVEGVPTEFEEPDPTPQAAEEKPAENLKEPVRPDDDDIPEDAFEPELDPVTGLPLEPAVLAPDEEVAPTLEPSPELTPDITPEAESDVVRETIDDPEWLEAEPHEASVLGKNELPRMLTKKAVVPPGYGVRLPRAIEGPRAVVPKKPGEPFPEAQISAISEPVRGGAQWGVVFNRQSNMFNIFKRDPPVEDGSPGLTTYYSGDSPTRRPIDFDRYEDAIKMAKREAKAWDSNIRGPMDIPRVTDPYKAAISPKNLAYRASLEAVPAEGTNVFRISTKAWDALPKRSRPGKVTKRLKNDVDVELDQHGFARMAELAGEVKGPIGKATVKRLQKQAEKIPGIRKPVDLTSDEWVAAMERTRKGEVSPEEVAETIAQAPEPAAPGPSPPIVSLAEAKGPIKAEWTKVKVKKEKSRFGELIAFSQVKGPGRKGKPGVTETAAYDPKTGKRIPGAKVFVNRNEQGRPIGVLLVRADGTGGVAALKMQGRKKIIQDMAAAAAPMLEKLPKPKVEAKKAAEEKKPEPAVREQEEMPEGAAEPHPETVEPERPPEVPEVVPEGHEVVETPEGKKILAKEKPEPVVSTAPKLEGTPEPEGRKPRGEKKTYETTEGAKARGRELAAAAETRLADIEAQQKAGTLSKEKGSEGARLWQKAKMDVVEANRMARGGTSKDVGIDRMVLGVNRRELNKLGVPKGEAQKAIHDGILFLARGGKLDDAKAVEKVFTDALGQVAGKAVHKQWAAEQSVKKSGRTMGDLPPELVGMAGKTTDPSGGPVKLPEFSVPKEFVKGFMKRPRGGTIHMGRYEIQRDEVVYEINVELPTSNNPIFRAGQKLVLKKQQALEKAEHETISKIIGFGKTYDARAKSQRNIQADYLLNAMKADHRIQPSMIPHARIAFPIIEAAARAEVLPSGKIMAKITRQRTYTNKELHELLVKKGVDVHPNQVSAWYQKEKQALVTAKYNKEQALKRAKKGHWIGQWMDTMNQLAVITTLYLKPGYVTPNFLGQVAMTLSDHGLSPKSMTQTWKLSRETRKMNPALTQKIMEQMQQGIVTSLGLSHGKIQIVSNGHHKMSRMYSTILDDPWREFAFYTEAQRHGFNTPEKMHKLLTEEDLGGKLTEVSMRANKNIVDFTRMSKTERDVFRRIIFFYPWLRGSSMFAARFMTEKPGQMMAITGASRQAQEKNAKLLGPVPSYMEGHIPVGTKNVPGLGKVPTTIDPTSFTVLGSLGEAINVARGLKGGVRNSEKISSYLTPAANVLLGEITRVDPFTGRSFPAQMGLDDIAFQELTQSAALTKLLLTDYPKMEKIKSGELDPKEILFPRSEGELLGRFWAGGVTPAAFNPREARSRASAELRGLESKQKGEVEKHKAYLSDYENAAKQTGLIKSNEKLPVELRQAFTRRARREGNLAATKLALGRELKPIDRLQADLTLLIRDGTVKEKDARKWLLDIALAPESVQNSFARQIREMLIQGDIISLYRKSLNVGLEAQGQPIITVP